MPKEVIYGKALPYGETEAESPARAIVEVRWDRDTGYFQMVTRCVRADDHSTFVPDYVAEWIADHPSVASSAGGVAVSLPALAQEGFYVDLNREGINRLIRNLRRARDQAFGRDE